MKLYIILLGVMISSFTYAQSSSTKFSLKWSEQLKMDRFAKLHSVLGTDGNGFLISIEIPNGLYHTYEVWDLNNDLSVKRHNEIVIGDELEGFIIRDICSLKGKVFAIGSYNVNEDNMLSVIAVPIDKATLELNAADKIVLAKSAYESRKSKGRVDYRMSENKEAIHIRINHPYIEGKVPSVTYKTFDKNLNVKWEHRIDKAVDGKEGVYRQSNDFFVDDYGNVIEKGKLYGLAEFGLGNDSKKYKKKLKANGGDEKIQEYLSIYSGAHDSPMRIELPLMIEGKYVHTFTNISSNNEKIVFAGVYSNESSKLAHGFICFEINLTDGSIIKVSTNEFTQGYFKQYCSRNANSKKDKGDESTLFDYRLKCYNNNTTGACTIIIEQFFLEYYTSGSSSGTTFTYHYGDLILVDLDADGQIEWTNKIDKRQSSSRDKGKFHSYYGIAGDDKYYIVINDNIDNINQNGNVPIDPYLLDDGYCSINTIYNDGEIERDVIYKFEDTRLISAPQESLRIDDKRHLIFTQLDLKAKFLIVEMK